MNETDLILINIIGIMISLGGPQVLLKWVTCSIFWWIKETISYKSTRKGKRKLNIQNSYWFPSLTSLYETRTCDSCDHLTTNRSTPSIYLHVFQETVTKTNDFLSNTRILFCRITKPHFTSNLFHNKSGMNKWSVTAPSY